MGIREARLGAKGLASMVELGQPMPAQADGEVGEDASKPSVGHPERGGPWRDERPQRVDEQQNPADQGQGLRLSQPPTVQDRDPVPSRWP